MNISVIMEKMLKHFLFCPLFLSISMLRVLAASRGWNATQNSVESERNHYLSSLLTHSWKTALPRAVDAWGGMEEGLCLVLITQLKISSLSDHRAASRASDSLLAVCLWRHPWQLMNQTNCNSYLVMKKNDMCVLLNEVFLTQIIGCHCRSGNVYSGFSLLEN